MNTLEKVALGGAILGVGYLLFGPKEAKAAPIPTPTPTPGEIPEPEPDVSVVVRNGTVVSPNYGNQPVEWEIWRKGSRFGWWLPKRGGSGMDYNDIETAMTDLAADLGVQRGQL